jgi:hypothetical protein
MNRLLLTLAITTMVGSLPLLSYFLLRREPSASRSPKGQSSSWPATI